MKLVSAFAAGALLALAATAAAQPQPGSPAAQSPALPPPASVLPHAPPLPPQTGSAPAMVTALQGADRDAALTRVNAALNAVTRLQGRFVQTYTDGSRASGAFYLQRPGKLRFEYDPPASLLIVSDGITVAQRDRALRTTDRTLLRATPLNLVLRSQVDLSHNARITRVARAGDWVLVTVRDRSGHTEGELTLQFQGDQLRGWDISDASGLRTHVALTDVTQPDSIDRRMFRLDDIVENGPGAH